MVARGKLYFKYRDAEVDFLSQNPVTCLDCHMTFCGDCRRAMTTACCSICIDVPVDRGRCLECDRANPRTDCSLCHKTVPGGLTASPATIAPVRITSIEVCGKTKIPSTKIPSNDDDYDSDGFMSWMWAEYELDDESDWSSSDDEEDNWSRSSNGLDLDEVVARCVCGLKLAATSSPERSVPSGS